MKQKKKNDEVQLKKAGERARDWILKKWKRIFNRRR